ncbi:MAG: tail virion protein G7P-2 [Vibrio litoralis]
MTQEQFDSLWLLIFIIGLVVCFGLGAIWGGQR